jgi:hypothetical protein
MSKQFAALREALEGANSTVRRQICTKFMDECRDAISQSKSQSDGVEVGGDEDGNQFEDVLLSLVDIKSLRSSQSRPRLPQLSSCFRDLLAWQRLQQIAFQGEIHREVRMPPPLAQQAINQDPGRSLGSSHESEDSSKQEIDEEKQSEQQSPPRHFSDLQPMPPAPPIQRSITGSGRITITSSSRIGDNRASQHTEAPHFSPAAIMDTDGGTDQYDLPSAIGFLSEKESPRPRHGEADLADPPSGDDLMDIEIEVCSDTPEPASQERQDFRHHLVLNPPLRTSERNKKHKLVASMNDSSRGFGGEHLANIIVSQQSPPKLPNASQYQNDGTITVVVRSYTPLPISVGETWEAHHTMAKLCVLHFLPLNSTFDDIQLQLGAQICAAGISPSRKNVRLRVPYRLTPPNPFFGWKVITNVYHTLQSTLQYQEGGIPGEITLLVEPVDHDDHILSPSALVRTMCVSYMDFQPVSFQEIFLSGADALAPLRAAHRQHSPLCFSVVSWRAFPSFEWQNHTKDDLEWRPLDEKLSVEHLCAQDGDIVLVRDSLPPNGGSLVPYLSRMEPFSLSKLWNLVRSSLVDPKLAPGVASNADSVHRPLPPSSASSIDVPQKCVQLLGSQGLSSPYPPQERSYSRFFRAAPLYSAQMIDHLLNGKSSSVKKAKIEESVIAKVVVVSKVPTNKPNARTEYEVRPSRFKRILSHLSQIADICRSIPRGHSSCSVVERQLMWTC